MTTKNIFDSFTAAELGDSAVLLLKRLRPHTSAAALDHVTPMMRHAARRAVRGVLRDAQDMPALAESFYAAGVMQVAALGVRALMTSTKEENHGPA